MGEVTPICPGEQSLDLQVSLLDPAKFHRQRIRQCHEEVRNLRALFTTDVNYSRTSINRRKPPLDSTHSGSKHRHLTPGLRDSPSGTGGTSKSCPASGSLCHQQTIIQQNSPAHSTHPGPRPYAQPALAPRRRYPDIAEYSIRIARLEYQQSEARTKLEVTRVLAEAQRDYWRVYAAREHLLVQKQQYELGGRHSLTRAEAPGSRGRIRARPKSFRAPESGVADQVGDVITADDDLVTAERNLKLIMNRPDLPMDGPTVLVPSTPPHELFCKLDVPKLAVQAVRDRMEMLDTELQIAQDTLTIGFAKNGMLPLVDLTYTYDINGLGPTSHDAIPNGPQHGFSGQYARAAYRSSHRQRSRFHAAFFASGTLAQPHQQQLATRQQRIASIKQDLYNAATELTEGWDSMLAARKRVEMNARLLDVEIRQFQQGLQTSTDVLNAQTTLGIAKDSKSPPSGDYQIACKSTSPTPSGTILRIGWYSAGMRRRSIKNKNQFCGMVSSAGSVRMAALDWNLRGQQRFETLVKRTLDQIIDRTLPARRADHQDAFTQLVIAAAFGDQLHGILRRCHTIGSTEHAVVMAHNPGNAAKVRKRSLIGIHRSTVSKTKIHTQLADKTDHERWNGCV